MVGRHRLFRQLYGKSMMGLWVIKIYKGKQIPKPNPPASLPHPHVFMYCHPFPIRHHLHPPFTPFPVVGSRQEAEPRRRRAVSRRARGRTPSGRGPRPGGQQVATLQNPTSLKARAADAAVRVTGWPRRDDALVMRSPDLVEEDVGHHPLGLCRSMNGGGIKV